MPEATQIQLGAERDIGLYELALAAAKAGALGGAVGNVPRAMVSYGDWLSDVKSRPVIFRGLRGDITDPRAPMAGSRFRGAYATSNPALAATYATPSRADLDRYGGGLSRPHNRVISDPNNYREMLDFNRIAEGGSVYPLRATSQDANRISTEQLEDVGNRRMDRVESLTEIVQDTGRPMHERRAAEQAIKDLYLESEFNTLTADTPRGAINVRRTELPDTWAEYPPLDPSHLSAHPSDTYSWADPSAVEVAGKPFKANESAELLRASARRLGYPEEGLQNQRWLHAQEALQGWGNTPYSHVEKGGPVHSRKTEYSDHARELIDEVQNDPRFLPTKRARAAQFLKGAAKEALSLKNILTDAGIGSLAGLASTVVPYEAYRPRTGGTFTAPGPGYEDALSKKDILEIAARKEAENDARRLAGIEKVNEIYGPGTLGPNARTAEIADYLGPIR